MKLDLHGTYHSEVPPKVDRFLWECINDNRVLEADIVTGNSQQMKDIVIGVIEEHGFNYSIGNPWNKGFVRVSFLH